MTVKTTSQGVLHSQIWSLSGGLWPGDGSSKKVRGEDAKPLEEVTNGSALLCPAVPGEGAVELLELHDGGLVPSPQALQGQGDKYYPFLEALVSCCLPFSGEGLLCSMARGGRLEGVHHRHVPGSVLAPRPVGQEDVRGLPAGVRKQVLTLLGGSYPCCHCCRMEHVAQGVVAAYPGASCCAT